MEKSTIDNLWPELAGKRVFLRIDTSGEDPCNPIDEVKVRASLPTLNYLIKNGARVIIGTHLGNPAGKVVDSLRLDMLAQLLAKMVNQPVVKINSTIGPEPLRAVNALGKGEILMLENLFFLTGELDNSAQTAYELGLLADIYCNDAFTLAQRGLASTVGIVRHVKYAVAGLTMDKEIKTLESALANPPRPMAAIIGGSRLSEKLPLLENLLPRLDRLLVGGQLALYFLKAKGYSIGSAHIDRACLPAVERFLRNAERSTEIILPSDLVVADNSTYIDYKEGRRKEPPDARITAVGEVSSSDLPLDIGPLTINRIRELVEGVCTLVWNGPLGMWELAPFSNGTRETAKMFLQLVSPECQRGIICGESLAHALRKLDVPVEQIHHLTMGGDATMAMLAGQPLPAIAALNDHYRSSEPRRRRRILLPVDGSKYSLTAAEKLSELVDEAEITLLYVWQQGVLKNDQQWVEPGTARAQEFTRQLEAERIFAEIDARLARQGLISQHWAIVSGDPATEIINFAERNYVDLIVMGSHGRGGLLRLLLGSVSQKVLEHAKCPVLIARAPDEQSISAGMAV